MVATFTIEGECEIEEDREEETGLWNENCEAMRVGCA